MIVEKPLISIIVPVYNVEKYIGRCIDSIRNQTYTEIEIILINDGSTDSSRKICEEYRKIDNRITLYNQKNSGPSAARNYGLEKANGKLVQFVDSDDYIELGMTERLIKEMADLKSSQVICSYNILRVKAEKIVKKDIKKINFKFMEKNEFLDKFYSLYDSGFINSLCNKLYNKDLIDKYKIKLNEAWNIGEDLVFNLDYYRHIKTVSFVSEPLYNYCNEIEGHSLMSSYKKDYAKGVLERFEYLKEFLTETNIYDKHKTSFYHDVPSLLHVMFMNVFAKDGNLSKQEKQEEIEYVLDWAEFKEYLDLKSNRNSLKEKILVPLVKLNNSKLIYYFYWFYSKFR